MALILSPPARVLDMPPAQVAAPAQTLRNRRRAAFACCFSPDRQENPSQNLTSPVSVGRVERVPPVVGVGRLDTAPPFAPAVTNYFIKSAGTADDPPRVDWYRWGKNAEGGFGDPNLFPRRPSIALGDRLVFYAVGSAKQFKFPRIFAVAEVTSDPEPSGHDRWPWQVRTRMLVPGPRLLACPTLGAIDKEQTSLRQASHITLSEEMGKLAEKLIARAAERSGSLGHCYHGPPPPADFRPGE
jgi:hypothetical protein